MVKILGLNSFHPNSSSCLVQDGIIKFCIEEERINRIKNWSGFPEKSIEMCLSETNTKINEMKSELVLLNKKTKEFIESYIIESNTCDKVLCIISDDKNVCGKENFPEFNEHRRDQSILTNIAIKYGLSVVGSEIRDYIECNYEYWYERNSKEGFNLRRPIDKLLVELEDKMNA